MPLSPLTPVSARYYLRRRSHGVSGPFEVATLMAMLADGRLDGSEEISPDREVWRSVRTLAPSAASATQAGGSNSRIAPLELGDDGDVVLAPLDIGFGNAGDHSEPAAAIPAITGIATGGSDRDLDAEAGGIDLGASLELEERRPASRPALAVPAGRTGVPVPATAPANSSRATTSNPGMSNQGGTVPHGAGGAGNARPTFSSLLQAEVEQVAEDATKPVRLDDARPPQPEERVRRRTLTAARGGGGVARGAGAAWRPSRRVLLGGGGVALMAAVAAATVVADLPDRLRGEPSRAAVLGPTELEIAQDRFRAFAEGARRLEEAAGTRRHVPITRAAAAELLASSVVIHGAEPARIVHAEALLEVKAEPDAELSRAARARARAWVALAKGRWKDAEEIASGAAGLAESDRAVLRGWAALGRQDAPKAVVLFQSAVDATPPPAPSRVAARYALARAREADLSPEAEAAFRAVLAEEPGHFGAALAISRVSKLSAVSRLKVLETVIGKQGQDASQEASHDASRAELGEAYALMSRAAYEAGLTDRVEEALKLARNADPACVAAAVLRGDILLAEGRTDEAIVRYRVALSAPISASRTPSFWFARVAALLESARTAEAATALADLGRRLPGDPRISFWRGRAAERAQPADAAGAQRAYREAIERDPHFVPAALQLARLLLDQHHGTEALAVLRRTEKEGSAPATLRLALGQALLASGNTAEAARTFRQGIAANAKDRAAHMGLAGALEAAGDLEGARLELVALQDGSDVPELGSRTAAVLVKLGRKEEALGTYRKEIAAGTAAATTKVAAARLALELGHNDIARTLAQAAVNDDPRTPGALLALADVRRAEGDLGSALAELKRALAVDGSPEVQLEYGRALATLGRDEEALSALAQASAIPEAAVERGRILLRRGDVEAASRELTGVSARLPSNAEAFLLLGQAEDRLGHAARAEAAWRAAVRLAPSSTESRYRLGRLQMDHGQGAAALANLRVAAEHLGTTDSGLPSWRPDLYFQLGFAELRQGSKDKGITAFKRYLDIAPADAPARAEVARQIRESAP